MLVLLKNIWECKDVMFDLYHLSLACMKMLLHVRQVKCLVQKHCSVTLSREQNNGSVTVSVGDVRSDRSVVSYIIECLDPRNKHLPYISDQSCDG